jgi:hypothetical protein
MQAVMKRYYEILLLTMNMETCRCALTRVQVEAEPVSGHMIAQFNSLFITELLYTSLLHTLLVALANSGFIRHLQAFFLPSGVFAMTPSTSNKS